MTVLSLVGLYCDLDTGALGGLLPPAAACLCITSSKHHAQSSTTGLSVVTMIRMVR